MLLLLLFIKQIISYAEDLENVNLNETIVVSFASDGMGGFSDVILCVSPASVTFNIYFLSWMKPNFSEM